MQVVECVNEDGTKKQKRRGAESGYMWVTMAGPNSSMVDPTELVEIITVGVVKIVSWREDDGGGSRSRKVHVRGGRWSSCQRRVEVNKTYQAKERKGLTISVWGILPENFIKDIAALTINEIGVHAQVFNGVSGARIFAQQL